MAFQLDTKRSLLIKSSVSSVCCFCFSGLDLSVILDLVPIQDLSPSGLDDVCQ